MLALAWPFCNLWAFNYADAEYIDNPRFLAAFVFSLFASLPLYVAILALTLFRSTVKCLYATAALALMFFNYHSLVGVLPQEWDHGKIVSWGVVTLVLCIAFYFVPRFAMIRRILPAVLLLMSVSVVASAVAQRAGPELPEMPGHLARGTYKPWRGQPLIQPSNLPESRPNVYHLTVDSLVRNDAFQKFYESDYSEFIDYLESNGFFVADESYSNFPVTAYSISSTLNMDFIVEEGPEAIYNTTADGGALLRGNSPVTAAFRARGYKILHTTNGFLPATECGGYEDRCIRKRSRLVTMQELGLVKATPILWLLDRFEPDWTETGPDDHLPDLRDGTIAFFHSYQPRDVVGDIPGEDEWPFFWFVHFMGVHNLAFDSQCDYQHPLRIYGRTPKPTRSALEIAYREQVPCMEAQLRDAIDAIIEVDPKAIIVVQGDHGTTMINKMRERPAAEWTSDDVLEVFGILNSIRLPGACRSRLYDRISPVNTFRVILGCIDGEDYEMLPDISLVAAYHGWWPDFPAVSRVPHPESPTAD